MSESHDLGIKGEELAKDHLLNKGYKILHLNWKSGKKEIDIVAENKDFIVFAEVKTRIEKSYMAGESELHPRHAVTSEKQKSIIYAAESYLKKYNIDKESRFDIIIIISKGKSVEIEHIEDAFYPTLR
jgi:putative endonuclease